MFRLPPFPPPLAMPITAPAQLHTIAHIISDAAGVFVVSCPSLLPNPCDCKFVTSGIPMHAAGTTIARCLSV